MALSVNEKIAICKKYDSILSKLTPLSDIMEDPFYPNFINFDDYKTRAEAKHIENAVSITNQIDCKIDRESAIEFIGKPGFQPELEVNTRVLNTPCVSLEDLILYRYIYEQIIINYTPLKQKDDEYIIMAKEDLIKLSKQLYHIKETIMFIPKNVFKFLEKIIEPRIEQACETANKRELLWEEARRRQAYTSILETSYNYQGKDAIAKQLTSKFGQNYDESFWNYKGIIELDNRKRNIDTKEYEKIEDCFIKSLK